MAYSGGVGLPGPAKPGATVVRTPSGAPKGNPPHAVTPRPARPQPQRTARPQKPARNQPRPGRVNTNVSGNPLLNPGVPLQGKALLQAAQSLTNAQVNPTLAALKSQEAANNAQTQGTMKLAGQYYNQAGQFAQSGLTQQQQIADALNARLAQIAQGTQSQLQGIGQQGANTIATYTPGSADYGAAGQAALAQAIGQQRGLAAQQAGNSQAFGATQGANYAGLSAANLGTEGLRSVEGLRNIAQQGTVKNQPLMNQIASTLASKGPLLATNEGKLRQQEIQNELTSQGLNNTLFGIQSANQRSQNTISAENARNTATINAANSRNRATIQGENQRNQASLANAVKIAQAKIDASATQGALNRASREAIAAANRAAKRAGQGPVFTQTGQRALSQYQQQRVFDSIDSAQSLIPQMQAPLSAAAAKSLASVIPGVQAGQKLSESQIRHLLQTGVHPGGSFKYTPAEVDAAYALAGYGYLTDKQITELNKMGVVVGNHYKRAAKAGVPNQGGLNSPH